MIKNYENFATFAVDLAFYMHGWGTMVGNDLDFDMQHGLYEEAERIRVTHGKLAKRGELYLSCGGSRIIDGISLRSWTMERCLE